MPQTNILEKRQRSLQQRKNRLKQFENSVNTLARKQRTRRLIELGGFVVKAHLEDWPTNTLFGAFLFLKGKESDIAQKNAWTFNGRVHFAADKKPKISVGVTFPEFPSEELYDSLHILGLKWNTLQHRWEGQGNVQELRVLLVPYGGEVREEKG